MPLVRNGRPTGKVRPAGVSIVTHCLRDGERKAIQDVKIFTGLAHIPAIGLGREAHQYFILQRQVVLHSIELQDPSSHLEY